MQIDPVKLKAAFGKSKIASHELAKAAGYESDRRINQLMAGKSTNINPRIGEAIAKKLKVKTADITITRGES